MDPAAVRALFPAVANTVYLNHAAVAPISTRVADALTETTRECLDWGAVRYPRLLAGVERTRRAGARLLDVDPREVAFVKNTSEGVSFVAEGLGLGPGAVVVLPEGEFPSNVYPWLNLERHGVRVIRVPLTDGRLLADDYRAALDTPGVQVLAVSAVAFDNGFRNDLAALGEMCRDRDVFFFVDAIQALGCLPLAPRQLGIHALAADAHKWLLGPEGVGLLWVDTSVAPRLHPVEVGWKSVVDPLAFGKIRFELWEDARRFEPGSFSMIPIHGLGAALELLLEVGLPAIEARVTTLVDRAAEGLTHKGYRLLSSLAPEERSGILSFLPHTPAEPLSRRLLEAGVFVACRGDGIRISPHFYNNQEDMDAFLEALSRLDRPRSRP